MAEASGASIGTVSMALNQRGGVSISTRRRIVDIARDLGYDGTSGRRTVNPGIVSIVVERLPVAPTSDPFNRTILLSLESAARRAGYRIALEFVGSDEEPDTSHWRSATTSGIIILGGGDLGPDWVRAAVESEVPAVMVDNFVPDLELPTVVPDNLGGGYSATKYLLDAGHERIGFIRGPSKYWTLGERMAGYLLAIQRSDGRIDEDLIPPRTSHGEEKGYAEMKHLLGLPEPPTAVFAVSDKTAIGAYRAIRDSGLSVPDDVSVIGFDDIGEARTMDPPLTTVNVPGDLLGDFAFRRLKSLVDDGEFERSETLKWTVPTSLVVRDSVKRL